MIALRIVTLISPKLAPVIEDFKHVFEIEVGFVDDRELMVEQFGLKNNMLVVGSQFIEVMEPVREKTAGGKFLAQRGEGGYMFVMQTDESDFHDALIKRAGELGVRIAVDHSFSYAGEDARMIQLHPADTEGSFFMFEHTSFNELEGSFPAAGGRVWQKAIKTDLVDAITAVEVQAVNVETVAEKWSKLFAIPLRKNEKGQNEIPLKGSVIRFVKAAGDRDGLGAMDIRTKNRQKVLENARSRSINVDGSHLVIGGIGINIV